MDELRPEVEKDAPGVEIEFTQILQDMLGDLQGTPEPVEVKLFGDNMPALEATADDVGDKLQKIPGIVDFKGGAEGQSGKRIPCRPHASRPHGSDRGSDHAAGQSGALGLAETSLRESDRTIDIRIRFPDSFRYDYNDIAQFPSLPRRSKWCRWTPSPRWKTCKAKARYCGKISA